MMDIGKIMSLLQLQKCFALGLYFQKANVFVFFVCFFPIKHRRQNEVMSGLGRGLLG